MKNFVLFLFTISLLLSLIACNEGATETSDPESTVSESTSPTVSQSEESESDVHYENIEAKQEAYLSLSAGVADKQLTYRQREEGSSKGYEYTYYEPTAFCVLENGNVAFVDSVAQKIKVFDTDAKEVRTVEYTADNEYDMPVLLAEEDGMFCVVMIPYGQVCDCDEKHYCYALLVESEKQTKVSMESDAAEYTKIPRALEFTESKKAKMTAENHRVIEIDFESDRFTDLGVENPKLSTIVLTNTDSRYIGSDENGEVYFRRTVGDGDEKSVAVTCYDQSGESILSAEIDYPDDKSYTATPYTVSGGYVYYFVCTESTVEIFKVTLGNS